MRCVDHDEWDVERDIGPCRKCPSTGKPYTRNFWCSPCQANGSPLGEVPVPATAQKYDSGPYASLRAVLDAALLQSSDGKGKERHATEGEAFEDQQIVQLAEWMGNGGFPIGQACKKAIESTRLPYEGARRELLGAIVYLAAEVIRLDRKEGKS